MSTSFWDKSSLSAVIPYATQYVVQTGQGVESLADFVRRVRQEQSLSLVEVERRSGHSIGRTHINRIENGEQTNPSPRKLQALARGLGVTEEELFAHARGAVLTEPAAREEKLLIKFRQLPENWQRDLMKILDVLHRQHAVHPTQLKTEKKPARRVA